VLNSRATYPQGIGVSLPARQLEWPLLLADPTSPRPNLGERELVESASFAVPRPHLLFVAAGLVKDTPTRVGDARVAHDRGMSNVVGVDALGEGMDGYGSGDGAPSRLPRSLWSPSRGPCARRIVVEKPRWRTCRGRGTATNAVEALLERSKVVTSEHPTSARGINADSEEGGPLGTATDSADATRSFRKSRSRTARRSHFEAMQVLQQYRHGGLQLVPVLHPVARYQPRAVFFWKYA
jgi:hypothetical protein